MSRMKNNIGIFLLWFFGSACLGLVLIVFTSDATQVNCLRQASGTYDCQLRTMFLGKVPVFQRNVQNVTGINITEDEDKDGITYEARFTTANGNTAALTGDSDSNYEYIDQQVTAIRSQIASGADQISYTVAMQLWVLFLTGGMTLMSMALSFLWLGRGRRRA